MAKMLKRRSSGFVKYPHDFEKRIIDGTARYRTKCDMLVGPCACGGVHQEDDTWVNDMLRMHGTEIEPFIIRPKLDGVVIFPRYWFHPLGHESCNVLSGYCRCGRVHTANEQWVLDLLLRHNAELQDCPEILLPPVGEPANFNMVDQDDPALSGCSCDRCRERRDADRSQTNGRLDRRNI